MNNLKTLIMKVASVSLGIFIAICISELFCRLFPNITGVYTTVSNSIPRIHIEDEKRGYALLPASVSRHCSCYGDFDVAYHINFQGIRSLKGKYGKKTCKRILLLGDSFVFGNGVKDNETLSVRLEEILNKNYSGNEFEVINAAVTGYTLDQEYMTLKTFSYLNLDIVLLGLCSNDSYVNRRVLDDTGDIVKISDTKCHINRYNQLILSPKPCTYLKQFCRDHLFVYTFLGSLRHKAHKSSKIRYREFRINQDRWKGSLEVLALIKKFCKENSAEFAVFTVQSSNRKPDNLAKYLEMQEIPFFDMPELYLIDKNLYYPNDGHWSPGGTVAVANWLADCLQKETILENAD